MKHKTLTHSLELMSLDSPTAPVYTQLARQIERNQETAAETESNNTHTNSNTGAAQE